MHLPGRCRLRSSVRRAARPRSRRSGRGLADRISRPAASSCRCAGSRPRSFARFRRAEPCTDSLSFGNGLVGDQAMRVSPRRAASCPAEPASLSAGIYGDVLDIQVVLAGVEGEHGRDGRACDPGRSGFDRWPVVAEYRSGRFVHPGQVPGVRRADDRPDRGRVVRGRATQSGRPRVCRQVMVLSWAGLMDSSIAEPGTLPNRRVPGRTRALGPHSGWPELDRSLSRGPPWKAVPRRPGGLPE